MRILSRTMALCLTIESTMRISKRYLSSAASQAFVIIITHLIMSLLLLVPVATIVSSYSE